jgi:hypothetical protein
MNASTLIDSRSLLSSDADGLALGAHVRDCDRSREPAFALYCIAERLHQVIGPRFFTTVFAAAIFMTLLAGCA